MYRYFLLLLICISMPSSAIFIRHDIDESQYLADINDFKFLATLYDFGVHGSLIHPQWVVTAAHAVICLSQGSTIRVGDKTAQVSNIYISKNYDSKGEHDIALIKLQSPLIDVPHIKLYTLDDEENMNVWILGAGSSGNGLSKKSTNQKKLLLAENKITETTNSDIYFIFDKGLNAEPLEGASGNGDSGGPAFIYIDNDFYLLGISSRTGSWFKGTGEYGVKEVYTRISTHIEWIEGVINGSSLERAGLAESISVPNTLSKSRQLDLFCNGNRS